MSRETVAGIPYNEYMRSYMLRRYHRRRTEAIEKLGGRCVDCGTHDLDALEFDHKNRAAKSFDLGKAFTSMAQKHLDREIAKCVLRCRPCHEIKSVRERGMRLRSERLIEHARRSA